MTTLERLEERVRLETEILRKGREVWENDEAFNLWLNSRLPELGDTAPVDVITSGKRLQDVLDVIGRLEHGMPA